MILSDTKNARPFCCLDRTGNKKYIPSMSCLAFTVTLLLSVPSLFIYLPRTRYVTITKGCMGLTLRLNGVTIVHGFTILNQISQGTLV